MVGHAFGENLGGDRIGEAAAGGQVDGLQDAVDGPADRGAVSALVPGREFQVAGVFGESGIGRFAERAGGGRLGRGRSAGILRALKRSLRRAGLPVHGSV